MTTDPSPSHGFPAARPLPREESPSLWLRAWLAVPDWVFRAIGCFFFLGYVAVRFPAYMSDFWTAGPWFQDGRSGVRWTVPWARVLIDLTYVLIAVGFLLRTPPKSRARRPLEILLPLLAAFWPFWPFILQAILQWLDPPSARAYSRFMLESAGWTPLRFLLGASLIVLGNALDVWGYAYLVRSLSIVVEARQLIVRGPYRFIRHPIYLGQMIAQAGVWLVFAPTHIVWIVFYLCFVGMQLWRARLEDAVLEGAFGEPYRVWKRGTIWLTA